MALYASIDQGNTATKLTVWRDGEPVARLVSRTPGNVAMQHALTAHGPLDGAIYCSVRPRNEVHWQMLRDVCGDSALELSHSTPLPIELHYDTPQTLGLDRIAAASGAVAVFPGRECIVADIGTAITYDSVGPDASFHGGNIAPGAGMRLRAMHAYTAALPKVDVDGPVPPRGTDTVTAMRCGALMGIVAELAWYRDRLPADGLLVLTGGRAATIAPLLPFDAVVDTDLVGRGLISILQYNLQPTTTE